MANTKITIDHTLVKSEKWYNMKYNGKDAGISVASAPKTIAEIDKGAIEIEVNLVEKDGKYYFWDKQEVKSAGNKFQMSPEQMKAKQDREDHTQRMIVAQNSATNATQFYAQRTGASIEDVKKYAAEMYRFVMEISK